MVDPEDITEKATCRDYAFWHAHGGVGLVWSNPDASDSVMIANALLRPSQPQLTEIAAHFGLERLKAEWSALSGGIRENNHPEEVERLRRVTPIVEKCIAQLR